MNNDGVVSISDVGQWIGWAYFYPGDALLGSIMAIIPEMATFFEISPANYGGVLSGLISFNIWAPLIGLSFLLAAATCISLHDLLAAAKRRLGNRMR